MLSRWYRPPELLWGARSYSSGVDIWSIGTIFVELILRVPFLAGDTDIDQLKKTFHAMGTPTEQEWPVSTVDDVCYSQLKLNQGTHQAARLS